jgi:predicted PhzF superfamily epimerase YddE/YHI9
MEKNIIYQVDSFTDIPFKGNPAGVMILEEPLAQEQMQLIAREMNLSETAFLYKDNHNVFRIRYFTPASEIPLCGHATLASAHIIYQLGLKAPEEEIRFKTNDNTLRAQQIGNEISMVFPRYKLDPILTPGRFKELIGFQPQEYYQSDYGWFLAVAGSQDHIRSARPDFEKMKTEGPGHLIITAKSETYPVDFVCRCFAPSLGVNEDPVTGSAHCALTPLWAQKLGKDSLESMQLSERTGRMTVRLLGEKVEIRGHAVTIFQLKTMY